MKVLGVAFAFFFSLSVFQPVAQSAPTDLAPEFRYDHGVVADGAYTNPCMGISVAIPTGWKVRTNAGASDTDGYATHFPGDMLALLMLEGNGKGAFGLKVTVMARSASNATVTLKQYVSRSASTAVEYDPEHRTILSDAVAVDSAGKRFFRSDYKQNFPKGDALYISYIYTFFRGYFVGLNVSAGSPQELDDGARVLDQITFMEGPADSRCVPGTPRPDAPLMGVIGSVSSGSGAASQVRVSQAVSRGLLISNPNPEYPEGARKVRVQGTVVLQVVVSKMGDVENVSSISGDPLLVPASIAAVKNWKYRPYLLNGQAVKMLTTVSLEFQLPQL